MIGPLTLDLIQAASSRIAPHIRRTPVLPALGLKQPVTPSNLWLKLECLQVTGSFKPRGAMHKALSLSSAALQRGLITASGGNHGLAVAYAGWIAQVPTTIYLPENAPLAKAQKLRQWGAEVVLEGQAWDDAHQAATGKAQAENLAYIHPFADPLVMAGQGTITLEVFEDLPEVDTLLVAIGGGGLISGVSFAAKALRPDIRIIGIEATGAPTLQACLEAGRVVELQTIRTQANTLAPRKTEPINFEIIRNCVDEIVLVTDEQMQAAARWLWFEMGVAAELSGAAAIAALQYGQYCPTAEETVCAIVCGAGTAGIEAF